MEAHPKSCEKFKIRGGMTFSDTITYTHHGPVVWDTPYQTLSLGEKSIRNSIRQTSTGRALRWLAHDESNELRTFYLLNTAKNYDDFVHALEFFNCPGQNFAYADVEGNIAYGMRGTTLQNGKSRACLSAMERTLGTIGRQWSPMNKSRI